MGVSVIIGCGAGGSGTLHVSSVVWSKNLKNSGLALRADLSRMVSSASWAKGLPRSFADTLLMTIQRAVRMRQEVRILEILGLRFDMLLAEKWASIYLP